MSTAIEANDTQVSQKLDTILEAVKHMGEQLRQQHESLCRQKENMSIHGLSVVPLAQSSPKHSKQESVFTKPDEMSYFEVLKAGSKVQGGVARQLNDYRNASRGYIDKQASSLKSGGFRAEVAKVKCHVNWPQYFCANQIRSKQPLMLSLQVNSGCRACNNLFCIKNLFCIT